MADQPMLGRMPSWQNATSDGTAVAFSHPGMEADGGGSGGSGGQGVSGETVLGGDSIDVTENPDGSVTIDYNPDKPIGGDGDDGGTDCNDWSMHGAMGAGMSESLPNDWSESGRDSENDWGGDSCAELNGWGDGD